MGIITNIWAKCKGEWFTGLVLILVALLAFGLGRLSAHYSPTEPVEFVTNNNTDPIRSTEQKSSTANNIDNNKNVLSQEVVASKEGSKYHYPWCPGAKQIKAGNKVSFPTSAAARAAGYTPAGNCPNLN